MSEKEDPTNRAASELEQCRTTLDKTSPRAEAFDAIQTILGLAVPRSMGYSEDMVWKLRKRADELREENNNAR
jgi:hypothetical protein